MRRPIIAGNWKMFGTRQSVLGLVEGIKAGSTNIESVDLVVFPSFVFLEQVESMLEGSSISFGAQNMHSAPEGAFTGEISAPMLMDVGCRYVLVGHSERRHLFGEDNVCVAKKFLAAHQAGLTPVLCVGETLVDREKSYTKKIIREQLQAVIDVAGIALFKEAVIAYEPVWAIGTGKTASSEQAQEVHAFIREYLSEYNTEIAQIIRILYGGSVKPGNAKALFNQVDIDGGLVGGASLDADDFVAIAKQYPGS